MASSGPRTPRNRTPRGPSIRPVYETFEPKSEMKEKEEAYFLHIYLPGFVKEKIKINFMRSSQVVRVVGERPLGGNRISNFEQTYPVPENCEVEKLHGKYEQGTLIITMPKKQISPKAQGPTPLIINPPKKHEPHQTTKPKEVAKEPMPPKSPIFTRIMEQGEKSNMVKSTTPTKEMSKSQKGHEEIVPKPTSTMGFANNKQNDITTYIEKEKVKRKQKEDRDHEKKQNENPNPNPNPNPDQRYIDHNVVMEGKEITARPKEKETIIDKGKGKEEGENNSRIGMGINEVVTKIGEGNLNDEEKSLVANMGAAIFVIVALGAYVTYKFTSSNRP